MIIVLLYILYKTGCKTEVSCLRKKWLDFGLIDFSHMSVVFTSCRTFNDNECIKKTVNFNLI